MTATRTIPSVEEIRSSLTPLFQDEGLRLVLLFGSLAHGGVHNKSDIDLAFLFDKPADMLTLTNRVIRLLHSDNVDVVDLKRANPLLKYSAVKYGIVLYEKTPGTYNELYSIAFRRYVDTKKLREARTAAIRHFLEERGYA